MTGKTRTDAAQHLAYIRRVMEDTRRTVTMCGDYFILWGIAVLFGMIGTYIFGLTAPPVWVWPALWGGLMTLAWAATGLLAHRDAHRARTSAPVGREIGR